jgi:hypothetical protein
MSRERGARRERVFFGEDDDALFAISWRANAASMGAAVFCLLPDAQPPFISFSSPTARSRSGARFREGRRHYSSTINARLRVTGRLGERAPFSRRDKSLPRA